MMERATASSRAQIHAPASVGVSASFHRASPVPGISAATQQVRADQLGHRIGALLPQAPSGPVAAHAPIQRVRALNSKSGLDQELRENLNKSISRIVAADKRQDTSEKHIHKQMGMVDDVEHQVYDWFGQNQGTATKDQQRAMFDLLDDIQGHHKKLIKQTIDTGSSLWVKDNVDAAGRKDVDDLWGALVNGSDGFEMPTQVHTANGPVALPQKLQQKFKVDTLAGMARLMSRPKGRSLVKALHEGSDDGKGIDFMLPALPKLRATDGYETPYVGAQAAASSEQNAMLKLKGDKPKNRRVVPGKGSGSGVLIAPGVKDSSMVDFDHEDSPILSPAFIGVGHELIHAAHYQRGTYIGPRGAAPHATLPEGYDDDLEEFLTIAKPSQHRQKEVTASLGKLSGGSQSHRFDISQIAKLNEGIPTEAEIRGEHGLDIRHGHSSMANPIRFPQAQRGEDPGEHVRDSIQWLGNFGAPPPPQPQPQPQQNVQPAQVAAPAQNDGYISGAYKWLRSWVA